MNFFVFFFLADSCKKRWKYLRERYVQQKKVGDSPSYEHLSRPYLEKMKFLDNFIQPRKSYRNVGHLLPSPSNSQHNILDGHDESSAERSMSMTAMASYHGTAGGGSSEHLQQYSDGHNSNINVENAYQYYYQMQQRQQELRKSADTDHRHIPPPAPDLIKMEHAMNVASSSSSMMSSQPSPTQANDCSSAIDDTDQKRRRTSTLEQSMNNQNLSDAEDRSSITNDIDGDNNGGGGGDTASNNLHRSPQFPNDFLYPFYQHAQRHIRNSEQLLGELVTSELLKMSKDRKKIAQKKILEVLFFDD